MRAQLQIGSSRQSWSYRCNRGGRPVERLCNAYLWDDQAITGQALVVGSIVVAVTWMLILAGQTMRPVPQKGLDPRGE